MNEYTRWPARFWSAVVLYRSSMDEPTCSRCPLWSEDTIAHRNQSARGLAQSKTLA